MGQIIGKKPLPLRGNITSILPNGEMADVVLDLRQYMLISSNNTMLEDGSGNFDKYIVGNGTDPCKSLTIHPLEQVIKDYEVTFNQGFNVDSDDVYLRDFATDLKSYLNNQDVVRYNTNQNISGSEKGKARENIDSENLVLGYYVSPEDADETTFEGFYRDADHTQQLADATTYSTRKLYIDLHTAVVYLWHNSVLRPISGQPIFGASYDSNNRNIIINLTDDTSITIPLDNVFNEYTAGTGITIENNVVSQNYQLVDIDQLNDYLSGGEDDDVIRYVYEVEE